MLLRIVRELPSAVVLQSPVLLPPPYFCVAHLSITAQNLYFGGIPLAASLYPYLYRRLIYRHSTNLLTFMRSRSRSSPILSYCDKLLSLGFPPSSNGGGRRRRWIFSLQTRWRRLRPLRNSLVPSMQLNPIPTSRSVLVKAASFWR